MPDNDYQARSTRFSKSGTTVFVRLRVDRRGYEYARHWARSHEAGGTAEDQLEGYLNQALAEAMDSDKWQCPPEIGVPSAPACACQ